MHILKTDIGGFYRVKRGQSAKEIERAILSPVNGEVYAGRIIKIYKNLSPYRVKAGDSYFSIAGDTGCDERLLKDINGDRPVYPTAIIFVPARNGEKAAKSI